MKKFLIIVSVLFFLLIGGSVGYYFYAMSPVGESSELQLYELKSGTSKIGVADSLKEAGFIRSSLVLKAYLFFHSEVNLQAGIYEFSKNMTPEEIVRKMSHGEVKNDSYTVTLIEGRRITEYVHNISEKLEVSEEELLSLMGDQSYLQELINTYWFLDESILSSDLYYPLEGYFFPDTYEFYEKSTAKEIITKILNHTGEKLEGFKENIENSNYNVHEILSMAAIIELEAVSESDRNTVSQVIYKRLDEGMSLGMDVTTYYAVKKEMGSGLTRTDLNTISPYNTHASNTSMFGRLPVGPICNPSLMSINAVFNPTDTDYLYFYADIKTGIVYFTKTLDEHNAIIREVG